MSRTRTLHRFALAAAAVVPLAVVAPSARASLTPRPVTAAEAASPTCFGFSTGGATVYAVRLKASCDPVTAKCEVASYLARVAPSGHASTVGYLTLAKKDAAMPDQGEILATVNPASLAKANAAMADATLGCAVASMGQTLPLAVGWTATLTRNPAGEVVLRGDNHRTIRVPGPFEQLFWGRDARTWYGRRTVPTATGQDTEFFSFSVAPLFEPPPAAPSPQATALTAANLAAAQCLGVDRGRGAFFFSETDATFDPIAFRVIEAAARGVLHHDVASRPFGPGHLDPRALAATVTAAELAFGNALLANVDAPCQVFAPPPPGAPPVAVPFTPADSPILASQLTTSAGPVLRLTGPRGSRRDLPVTAAGLLVFGAPGAAHLVVRSAAARPELTRVVALADLAREPALFPLPDTLPAPVCLAVAGPWLLDVERAATGASLVLRPAADRSDATPIVLAAGPPAASAEQLLASVGREQRIDLAERFPAAAAPGCLVEPLGAARTFTDPRRGEITVAPTSAGPLELTTATHRRRLGLAGEPRYLVRLGAVAFVATEDADSRLALGRVDGAWERFPEAPEVAARAPKPLAEEVPDVAPADRRCLGWQRRDRVAWVVRWQSDCPGGADPGFDDASCVDVALLTEVRKDGYFQRTTLAKDGSPWTHMFGHANTLIRKADVGCVAGREASVAGRTFTVATTATDATVSVGETTKKVGRLTNDAGEAGDVSAVFWHPEIEALVIEIQHIHAVRYLWVDLAKIK